jgi:hypothetical protein
MVAGLLASAGYDMGPRLHRPTPGNPKGFFESPRINGINDALLRAVVPTRLPLLGRWIHPERIGRSHGWLARVPEGRRIPCPPALDARIRRAVPNHPFCFKDPRFCYTLPAWRPHIGDAVFVCVFRDPAVTVASILQECTRHRYHGIEMNEAVAFDLYTAMLTRVLDVHAAEGAWLFLHYDQVLDGDGIDRLERHVETELERTFADRALRRSRPVAPPPAAAAAVYDRLCAAAEYDPGAEQP